MTPIFSNPAPQWTDESSQASAAARVSLGLDASGFWVLPDLAFSGAFVDHASGFTVIDDTTTLGWLLTLLPSGFVVLY